MKLAVSPLPALDGTPLLTVIVRDTYGLITGHLLFLSIKRLSQFFTEGIITQQLKTQYQQKNANARRRLEPENKMG